MCRVGSYIAACQGDASPKYHPCRIFVPIYHRDRNCSFHVKDSCCHLSTGTHWASASRCKKPSRNCRSQTKRFSQPLTPCILCYSRNWSPFHSFPSRQTIVQPHHV